VGRALAGKLKLGFIDMDGLIEERAGMNIPEVFSRLGEIHFRKLEKETVQSFAGCKNKVIATGGGAIVDPENLRALKELGPVICLTATPQTIYERIRLETHRPLLQVPDPIGRIYRLLEEREPYYAQADYHLSTDGETKEELADKILAYISKPG
jgi:shikimate kinase